jgi:hypothetical protein
MIMNKIIGIGTLVLAIIAIVIGLTVILNESTIMGIVYGIILLIGGPVIIFSYCAKCPARKSGCAHYFPGLLTGLFKERKESPYNLPDYLGVIISIFLILLFPQPWLMQSVNLLIIFWLLMAVDFVLINVKICKTCSNNYCYLCKNRSVLEQ